MVVFNDPLTLDIGYLSSLGSSFVIEQLRPTHGPVEGFLRPSLGFCCSKSIPHTDNLSLF